MGAEQQYAWRVAESTAHKTPRVAGTTAGLLLTPARLRVWGLRSAMSLLDQGLTSGAGFGVNVFLARWLAPEVYGAFSVAFAGFLFISGFHNVLLLEPLSVIGPSGHRERLPAYFREQLAVHALLVGGLSAFILLFAAALRLLAPQSPLPGAVLGTGLALPFLLLLWLARRMCYVLQRPSIAVLGSSFYLSFILAGLFVLHRFGILSPFTAFLLMGSGSLLAASALLRRQGLTLRAARSWRPVLRENWTYGRWLVGNTVLFSISSQTQTFIVAGFLGLGAAGILRAMQIPSLVMTQVVFAAGPIILPAFSYDFGRGSIVGIRHKAALVSLGLGAVALSFAGLLALCARPVEHLLFGGKYAPFSGLIWVLALIPVAQGFSMGGSMALRASQRPHFDLVANAIAAPVAIVSAIVFMHWWGLAGAAASLVASFAAYTTFTCWVYYSPHRFRERWGFERT